MLGMQGFILNPPFHLQKQIQSLQCHFASANPCILPEPFSAAAVMPLHWVPHKDQKTISAPKSNLSKDKEQTVPCSLLSCNIHNTSSTCHTLTKPKSKYLQHRNTPGMVGNGVKKLKRRQTSTGSLRAAASQQMYIAKVTVVLPLRK